MIDNYTQLSIFYKGSWTIVTPSKVIKEQYGTKYYLIEYPFKLLKEGEEDPLKGIERLPGNYISISPIGTISYISVDYYNSLFPTVYMNQNINTRNSNDLKDPNFLTKVLQESPTSSYNRPIPKNL